MIATMDCCQQLNREPQQFIVRKAGSHDYRKKENMKRIPVLRILRAHGLL
jgi:hypothetical protein